MDPEWNKPFCRALLYSDGATLARFLVPRTCSMHSRRVSTPHIRCHPTWENQVLEVLPPIVGVSGTNKQSKAPTWCGACGHRFLSLPPLPLPRIEIPTEAETLVAARAACVDSVSCPSKSGLPPPQVATAIDSVASCLSSVFSARAVKSVGFRSLSLSSLCVSVRERSLQSIAR
jgi:hypothetical protein